MMLSCRHLQQGLYEQSIEAKGFVQACALTIGSTIVPRLDNQATRTTAMLAIALSDSVFQRILSGNFEVQKYQ